MNNIDTPPLEASFTLFFEQAGRRLRIGCRWQGQEGPVSAQFRRPDLRIDVTRQRESREKLGRRLYAALFPESIRKEFEKAWEAYQGKLWIRLEIGEHIPGREKLETIPWEAALYPWNDQYAGLSLRRPLIRGIGEPIALPPLQTSGPIRILVVGACPSKGGYGKFDMDGEARAVELAWRDFGDVDYLPHASFHDFCSKLRQLSEEGPVHVVQFIGHAGLDEDDTRSVLVFERKDGCGEKISAEDFAIQLARPELRLVVLSACSTAKPSIGWPYDPSRSLAYKLLRTGVPAVVGTRNTLTSGASANFLRVFHRLLAREHSPAAAAAEARRDVAAYTGTSLWDGLQEWTTPILYQSFESGRLLEQAEPAPLGPRRLAILADRHPYKEPCGSPLSLIGSFRHRRLVRGHTWQEVRARVRNFLMANVSSERPLALRMDAHLSICFAAGFCLAERGVDWTFFQCNSRKGIFEAWHPAAVGATEKSPTWEVKDEAEPGAGALLAVVVSITHDILPKVRDSWPGLELGPAHFVHFKLPGAWIENGSHAMALAAALTATVRELQRRHKVHLFLACPAGFAFFLGVKAGFLGRIQLYELQPDPVPTYVPSLEVDAGDRLLP